MNNEDSTPELPKAFRIVGIVVILATILVVAIMALLLFAPTVFFHPPHREGMFVLALVVSLLVSGLGGLLMTGATRNLMWLLTVLTAGGAVWLWLLFARAMAQL